jgi:hypothetical protein
LLTADTQNTRASRTWHAIWTWDIGGSPVGRAPDRGCGTTGQQGR